jgi:hypothetical protein
MTSGTSSVQITTLTGACASGYIEWRDKWLQVRGTEESVGGDGLFTLYVPIPANPFPGEPKLEFNLDRWKGDMEWTDLENGAFR